MVKVKYPLRNGFVSGEGTTHILHDIGSHFPVNLSLIRPVERENCGKRSGLCKYAVKLKLAIFTSLNIPFIFQIEVKLIAGCLPHRACNFYESNMELLVNCKVMCTHKQLLLCF
jgi:hypothetical protein